MKTQVNSFFEKYRDRLACQVFADANNLHFACAAIRSTLPNGQTIGTIISDRAANGDAQCGAIIDAYKPIKTYDDYASIHIFLQHWNAFRRDVLPGIVEAMAEKEPTPCSH